MNDSRGALPEFVHELDAEDGEITAVTLLPELLTPSTPPETLRRRLLSAVETLPLRYAPFLDRLSEVWDLPESSVLAVLSRAADPAAFRKTPLPGLFVLEVEGGPRVAGAEVHLVRFAPGMRFPRHRHPGDEVLFVLEGSYTDSSGLRVGPGDEHVMSAGTEHGFRVSRDEPCVAASVQRGREFTGFWIRLLSKFVP